MLQLNTMRAQPGAKHKARRLGRGTGSGKGQTAGRGVKGQRARKSGNVRIGFEGGQNPIYRRVPKKGFKNVFRATRFQVNVGDLAEWGVTGEVTLESLKQIGRLRGEFEQLVILGNGELKSPLTIKAHKVSASAKEKIEKAGGQIQILTIGRLKKRVRERGSKKTS